MKISIVICAYNPDPKIIGGLFESVANLKWPGEIEKEILLIDNASRVPLSGREDVVQWQADTADIRVIREEKPGLSNARVRGFKEAEGDLIVCFDDDNKPAPTYIEAIIQIEKKFPFIGIWGPGKVEVEWMPGGDPEVQKNFKHVYQQHSQKQVTYALDFVSPQTMPYGTGMILRKEVAQIYIEWFEERKRKTTDRIGTSLTSYGDVQICWLGMEAGWAVGRHPELHIVHVISKEKAQWNHLARLLFGIHSSYAPALKEALPDKYKGGKPSAHRLAGFLTYHFIAWLTKKEKHPLKVYMAKPLGQPTGAWKAEGVSPPWWIQKITGHFYHV